MANKLKLIFSCIFICASIGCFGQETDIIELEVFSVIGDTLRLTHAADVRLNSDKDIYNLEEEVVLTLEVFAFIATDGGGFGSPIFEFETKEFVEWEIYHGENLVFNYPKVFNNVDSSNIIINGTSLKDTLLWQQKNNDNEFVGRGEYKIVATILKINYPLSTEKIISIE